MNDATQNQGSQDARMASAIPPQTSIADTSALRLPTAKPAASAHAPASPPAGPAATPSRQSSPVRSFHLDPSPPASARAGRQELPLQAAANEDLLRQLATQQEAFLHRFFEQFAQLLPTGPQSRAAGQPAPAQPAAVPSDAPLRGAPHHGLSTPAPAPPVFAPLDAPRGPPIPSAAIAAAPHGAHVCDSCPEGMPVATPLARPDAGNYTPAHPAAATIFRTPAGQTLTVVSGKNNTKLVEAISKFDPNKHLVRDFIDQIERATPQASESERLTALWKLAPASLIGDHVSDQLRLHLTWAAASNYLISCFDAKSTALRREWSTRLSTLRFRPKDGGAVTEFIAEFNKCAKAVPAYANIDWATPFAQMDRVTQDSALYLVRTFIDAVATSVDNNTNLNTQCSQPNASLNSIAAYCITYFATMENISRHADPVEKRVAFSAPSSAPSLPRSPCDCGGLHWRRDCPNPRPSPAPSLQAAPPRPVNPRYGRQTRDVRPGLTPAPASTPAPAPAVAPALPVRSTPAPSAPPATAPGAPPAASRLTCYNCRRDGHTARECPEPRRDRTYLLGGPNQDASRFMVIRTPISVNGHELEDVVFDTGATCNLVNDHYVSSITGGPSSVSAIHGTYNTAGETEIDIHYGPKLETGVDGVPATVARDLPCDLVLGLPFLAMTNAVINFPARIITVGKHTSMFNVIHFDIVDRLDKVYASGYPVPPPKDVSALLNASGSPDVSATPPPTIPSALLAPQDQPALLPETGPVTPTPTVAVSEPATAPAPTPVVSTLPVEIIYEDPPEDPPAAIHTEVFSRVTAPVPSTSPSSNMIDELDPAPEFPKDDIVQEQSRDLVVTDTLTVKIGSNCPPAQAEALRRVLIEENAGDVLVSKLLRHGEANVAPVRLGIPADARPIQTKPRRDSPLQRQLGADWAAEGLKANLLEPSTSGWRGNVVFAKKPDGGLRPCADISHTANRYARRTAIQLPRIEEIADSVKDCRVFSRIDFVTGYQQLPIHPDDRQFTAIWVAGQLLQFRALPMGFTNSGAIFHQTIAPIFREVDWDLFFLYVDDGLIGDADFERHLHHVRDLIRVCRKYNLKLNCRKSIFLANCLSFIGHIISDRGLSPDPAKVAIIRNALPPSDKTGVQSFLGLANFCRNYIAGFADLASPLVQLTHQDTAFQWTDVHQHAFESLRDALCAAPCLALPDMQRPFVLKTDASNVAAGAVLAQVDDAGQERPVAYFSKTFTAAQRKYTATERELFAGVLAMRHFHPYLHSATPFRWVTDHAALQYIRTLRDNNTSPLRMRWLEYLDQFAYTVQYRRGTAHTDADALSRPPLARQDRFFMYRPRRANAGHNARYDNSDGVTPRSAKLEAQAKREAKRAAPARRPRKDAANAALPVDPSPDAPAASLSQPEPEPERPRIDVHPLVPTAQVDAPPGAPLRTLAVTLDGMAEEQRRDTQLDSLFASVGQGAFAIVDGLLVRLVPADHRLPFRPYPQLVIPTSRRHDFLKQVHDSLIAGHFGIKKTLHIAQRVAWWPTLREDVTHWVKSCTVCNAGKPDNHAPFGLVNSAPRSYLPWEVASIDFLGPLPITARGNRHIAICTCEATGDLELWATRGATAEDFVNGFITHIVCRGKSPSILRSDRGPSFKAAFFKEVCKRLNVELHTSGGYHSNFVGLAERTNRTVNHFLRTFAHTKLDDWDVILPAARLAIISSFDESRGETPFFLNHLHDARTPIIASLEARIAPPDSAIDPVLLPLDYKYKMLHAMHHALALASASLVKARAHQKKYANARRAPDPFQVGSLVYLNTLTNDKARSEKYRRQFEGPFRILRKTKDNIYTLVNVSTGFTFPHEVHVSRLREFIVGTNRPEPDLQLPDDDHVFSPEEGQLLSQLAPDDLNSAAQDALDDAVDPHWDSTLAEHLTATDAVPDDTPVLVPVFNEIFAIFDEFRRLELDAYDEDDPSETDSTLIAQARDTLVRLLVGAPGSSPWIYSPQHRTHWNAVINANLTVARMRRLLAHLVLRFARVFDNTITALRSQARKRRVDHSRLPDPSAPASL